MEYNNAKCGTLYVVATPIGNTDDISYRAKQILDSVDFIAAEDTREAGLLLKALGIINENKLLSNHKFNEKHREDYILSLLIGGRNVAVISDAGTPCISDPGGIIVSAAVERGIRVTPICGASSVTAALSVCGFAFDSYTFYGFLPRATKEWRELMVKLIKNHDSVSVFYESPKRIKRTLISLEAALPDATLCLCNDLTKRYERIYRGTPRQIYEELSSNPSAEKGEYTLVCKIVCKINDDNVDDNKVNYDNVGDTDLPEDGYANMIFNPHGISLEAIIIDYLVKHGGSIKDAVSKLSHMQEYNKNKLYRAAININRLLK